jgi:hypothetical protein
MGIDTLVFARFSKEQYEERLVSNEMQFIWEPYKVFTHFLFDHYDAPFDIDNWWTTFKYIDGKGYDSLHF